MQTAKVALITMVTTLTAVVVILTVASREPHVSGHFRAGPVAASPSGGSRQVASAPPAPLEVDVPSQPQGGTLSARPEPVSYDVSDAVTAPVQAVLSPLYGQPAALPQLVTQSLQESDQLGQINDHLAALRQQSADEESRRQGVAERETAQHAATLEALGTVRQMQALLAYGDSDGVDEELGRAEAALSGRTRLHVDAAREALGRSDLFQARQYLATALAERWTPG
jgi:hypothetical protein